MGNNPRKLTAEWQRERLFQARRRGGMCAACGRVLGKSETVYVEKFEDDRRSSVTAPVGAECASEKLLAETQGREPEHCAGCGRPMFYREAHTARRRQALCSRTCGATVQAARTAAKRQKAEA
jgi:hypothetical protein